MKGDRRVAIIGVTGFIGRGLPRMFRERGWRVTGVGRSGGGGVEGVDEWMKTADFDPAGHAAVVNLAGARIDPAVDGGEQAGVSRKPGGGDAAGGGGAGGVAGGREAGGVGEWFGDRVLRGWGG